MNDNCSNKDEFMEILRPEVYVAVNKLRELSSSGIPEDIRGHVWKYLLGVSVSDIAEEELNKKERSQQYSLLHRDYIEDLKRIQGEINRYHLEMPIFRDTNVRKMFENVITAYLTQNTLVKYTPILIHLCGPLVYVYIITTITNYKEITGNLKKNCNYVEPFIYYSFQTILSRIHFDDVHQDYTGVQLGNLINFMRVLIPEIHSHFEEEELDIREWAHSWIRSLLGCELPLHCVLRLWDTYLSHEDGFNLHPYVCIAILFNYKEDLEELDHSDLLSYLRRLPNMDMDKVIAQAFNIRAEIAEQDLI